MEYCSQCGHELDIYDSYCSQCGHQVKKVSTYDNQRQFQGNTKIKSQTNRVKHTNSIVFGGLAFSFSLINLFTIFFIRLSTSFLSIIFAVIAIVTYFKEKQTTNNPISGLVLGVIALVINILFFIFPLILKFFLIF